MCQGLLYSGLLFHKKMLDVMVEEWYNNKCLILAW